MLHIQLKDLSQSPSFKVELDDISGVHLPLYAYLFRLSDIRSSHDVDRLCSLIHFLENVCKAGTHSAYHELYQKLSVENSVTCYMIYPPLCL